MEAFTAKELFAQIKSDVRTHLKQANPRFLSAIGLCLFNPSFQMLFLYRWGHFFYCKKIPFRMVCEWLECIFFSCYINSEAEIGKNFIIAHPIGIVIGAAKIGNDVTIWQNVTIGSTGKTGRGMEYPVVGDKVRIFSHAVVVGKITIGAGATIGALSFVNKDVPAAATAVSGKKCIY
jgi:serine O-acetyltransferase